MEISLYKILNLNEKATLEEIKSAYRKLAKTYHPDINDEYLSNKRFTKINEAYEILKNIEKKAEYDSSLKSYRERLLNGTFTALEDLVTIGDYYFYGSILPQDFIKAGEFYKRAYNEGAWIQKSMSSGYNEKAYIYYSAIHKLGLIYNFGLGVSVDYKIAANYYKISAQNNYVESYYYINKMIEANQIHAFLMNNENFRFDDFNFNYASWQARFGLRNKQSKEAFENFEKLCDITLPDQRLYEQWFLYNNIDLDNKIMSENLNFLKDLGKLQFKLGLCYYEDPYGYADESTRNYDKAIKYFSKAIENGCYDTLYYAGLMYIKNKSYNNAMICFEKAKEYFDEKKLEGKSFSHIQDPTYELGYMYSSGFDVEKDLAKAREYYNSIINTDTRAICSLEELKNELLVSFSYITAESIKSSRKRLIEDSDKKYRLKAEYKKFLTNSTLSDKYFILTASKKKINYQFIDFGNIYCFLSLGKNLHNVSETSLLLKDNCRWSFVEQTFISGYDFKILKSNIIKINIKKRKMIIYLKKGKMKFDLKYFNDMNLDTIFSDVKHKISLQE